MKKELYLMPDISYHNGNVNIKRVRDSGYGGIGLRVGYGKNNIDQKFVSNATACVNLEVSAITYWFSYALSVVMAEDEADYCCDQVDKYWQECPVAFDLEYDTVRYARTKGINITKDLATKMATAFLSKVKMRGHIPVIYTNRDYLRNYFDMDKIVSAVGTVYVWYARYNSTLTESEWNLADIWQYTSSGSVPGISGKCDVNRVYTNLWLKSTPAQREETCNINIQNFQKAANADGYLDEHGRKLTEDGKDGKNTRYVRQQICLQAKRFGLTYKVGSTGEVVKWWQTRCNEILGHDQEEDGKYGKDARKETIAVQGKLNLVKDGKVGYNSIQAVFYN